MVCSATSDSAPVTRSSCHSPMISAVAAISAAWRFTCRSMAPTASRAAPGSARPSGASATAKASSGPRSSSRSSAGASRDREIREIGAVAAERAEQRHALGAGGEGAAGGVALAEPLGEPRRRLRVEGARQGGEGAPRVDLGHDAGGKA